MNTWFTVKVKYIKQLEDGRLKSVTEPYLVDAVNFTEAEKRIYHEVGQYVREGGFSIKGISKTEFADIFYYEDSDVWYKCKLTYISIDADEGKEKKITSNFLVTATSVKEAFERIHESLSDMTVEFEIPSIMVTPIVDVLPYDPSASELEDASSQTEKFNQIEDRKQEIDEDYTDEDFYVDSESEEDITIEEDVEDEDFQEDVTFVDETETE